MTNGHRGLASPPSDDLLAEKKRAVRLVARGNRAEAFARSAVSAPGELRTRFFEAVRLDPGALVAGYAAKGDELDVLPLLTALAERGHVCGLPVVAGSASPLIFRRWVPGMPLAGDAFGVAAPPSMAPVVRPTVLLVPMLAFDRTGQRMGYGAGFYDRTIAALRADGGVLTVGIAFAAQELPSVPVGPHDQPLDWIVTEREALRIAAAGT